MDPLSSRKALDSVCGLHVKPRAPFSLHQIPLHGDHSQLDSSTSSVESTQQQFSIHKVWQQRPDSLRPIHKGDQSVVETIANVITSLPFIALGVQVPRKNLNCKVYANSLIGVGVASCLYHTSRGRLRKYLRWLDYTMIAATTVCLSRVLRHENRNPKLLMAVSGLCLPFQPLAVSAIHTGIIEVSFAKRALENPMLRTTHNVHTFSTLLGGILFIADDIFPRTPFIHASWHLAAAVGVATCNKLLE